MKSTLQLSVMALVVIVLAGCKADDAMDATLQMKTDLGGLRQNTNALQKSTDGLGGSMGDLKNAAFVDSGLKMINDPENNQEVIPPPPGLLTGAQLIAEHMTTEQLINTFYLRIEEIENSAPDQAKHNRNLLGEYPPEYIAEFNMKKQLKVLALEAIAAQIPQQTVETIIAEQITGPGGGGTRSDTAYQLLMLRTMFLNSFFLDATTFGTKLDNVAKVDQAYKYISYLQYLASSPFANKIAFKVESDKFLTPVLQPAKLSRDPDCNISWVEIEKRKEAARAAVIKENPGGSPAEIAEKIQAAEAAIDAEVASAYVSCHPTLGQAPAFNESLVFQNPDDPNDPQNGKILVVKPYWKKIAKKIGTPSKPGDLPAELLSPRSPYAGKLERIRQEAQNHVDRD